MAHKSLYIKITEFEDGNQANVGYTDESPVRGS